MKNLLVAAMFGLFLLGSVTNTVAQDDPNKEREKVFGKPFEERVEEAVDRGCEWLKKQQGIEKGEDPAVFGQFPPNPPTYGGGEPHRYRFARTAFPIQALCKSGVFADDPAVVKAMEYLRKNYKENGVLRNEQGFVHSTTYEDATVLNAIEAFYTSINEAKERGLEHPSKRFYRDENNKKIPIKRWGTEEKGAKKAKEGRKNKLPIVLSAADKKVAELAVKALINRYRKAYGGGGWRYAPTNMGENDPVIDVSATQYAMMGLLCASRMGLKYDKKILFEIFAFMDAQQDKEGPEVVRKEKDADGKDVETPDEPKKDPRRSTRAYVPTQKDKARGWGYARQSKHGTPDQQQADRSTYGSMTAAGVCTLIMLREELENDANHLAKWKPLANKCQQMLNDGMAWMVMNWTLSENPKRGRHRYYYYLYTIERVGMLGGIDYIGAYDWYFEGADKYLLKQQTEGGKSDGMWDTNSEIDPSDVYDTCYALLFLKRATEGIDRPRPVFTGVEE